MEAYHFEPINRFKRFSKQLDVVTVLCSKSWIAFDDTGERELYIFQSNGTVLITTNGVGSKAKWQWIPVNNSLLIDDNDDITMLHAEYIDNVVLALSLDGTDRCAFFIEENNSMQFAPKTLGQLVGYFLDKERKLIEQQISTLDSKEFEQKMRSEEERIKECEELWRKRDQDRHMRRAAGIKSDIKDSMDTKVKFAMATVLCALIFVIFLNLATVDFREWLCVCAFLIIVLVGSFIAIIIHDKKEYRDNLEQYKIEHPNDPANQFLN